MERRKRRPNLTAIQLRLLKSFAKGNDGTQVAIELNLSQQTVSNRKRDICILLNVHNSIQMIREAIYWNIITIEEFLEAPAPPAQKVEHNRFDPTSIGLSI